MGLDMQEDSNIVVGNLALPRLFQLIIGVLAISACAVAVYLLQISLANEALPAGCGAGSGCDAVLNSRWSKVFGVPVSGPAVLVYLSVLVCTFLVGSNISPAKQRIAWSALTFLSFVIAVSAVWFVALQVIVIRAFCPWCFTGHVLGLTVAVIVFWKTPARTAMANGEIDEPTTSLAPRTLVVLRILGVVAVCVLATAQMFDKYRPPNIQRLQAEVNEDTGPGPNRIISLLDGKLKVEPHKLPMVGSPDAPKQVILLFDYCCPHCRITHGYVLATRKRYPKQLGVVLLPMPLNSECNPYWEYTEKRFEHACVLARLALAVWKADSSAFPEFDEWLFKPQMPRDPVEARQKAEQLVTAAALDAALADPWINDRIRDDAQAYHDSKTDRIPIIMSPKFATIVGEPESGLALLALFEKELELQSNDD
jgi:uncharacterized membrane protein/protein-disulfide isomerase